MSWVDGGLDCLPINGLQWTILEPRMKKTAVVIEYCILKIDVSDEANWNKLGELI